MKAVFLILVASSVYVSGQYNFFGTFQGYPLKEGQTVKSGQPLKGSIEGQIQIPSSQVSQIVNSNGAFTLNNVRGVLNGQEVQGTLHSIQIKNPSPIQGQVSSITDFLAKYGSNNLQPFPNLYSNIQPHALNNPIFSFQPGFFPIVLPSPLENVNILPGPPAGLVSTPNSNDTVLDHHVSGTEGHTPTTKAPSPSVVDHHVSGIEDHTPTTNVPSPSVVDHHVSGTEDVTPTNKAPPASVAVESDSHLVPNTIPEVLVDPIPVNQHPVAVVPASDVVPEVSADPVVSPIAVEPVEDVVLVPFPVPNVVPVPVPVAPVEIDPEWEAYKAQYEKSYESAAEDSHRRDIYYSNKQKIGDFNTNKAAVAGFDLGMNTFGDLKLHEFNNAVNGLTLASKAARKNKTSEYIPSAFVAKPKLVDWRNFTGAVTNVKDQGHCFSCWAFTAAAVLESHWWRKTGDTVDISEQNILDCRTDGEKDSCAPGFYTDAWEYIRDNKGVDGEESYPYESYYNDNFTCRFKREGVVAKVTGIINLEGEPKMELAVATQGPIAAAIDANTITQQFYKNGVYKVVDAGLDPSEKCTQEINHAVTIVGFGEEEDGQKYWLIKNSYGTSWGDNGYMKLARGVNMCGIALFPAYPLV